MPSVALIPDRQLTFSPELAETIGLEEAVLLQALGTHLNGIDDWTPISLKALQVTLPFWSLDHIAALITKLVLLGIISQQASHDTDTVILSTATSDAGDPVSSSRLTTNPNLSSSHSWQPSEALLELLVLNHGIPRSFIDITKGRFIPSEGSCVDTQFRQFLLSNWRETQIQGNRRPIVPAFEINAPAPFGRDWTPNQDALDILAQAGIDTDFAESQRAEFILYWSERGGPPREVNSRFVEHVRRRWLKHTSQLHFSTEPQRIPRSWQPDTSVYETLKLAGIDEAEARALIPEFVMYWVDSNEVHNSWNSKFLQHVKRQYRGAGYGGQDGGKTGRSSAGGGHRSKDRSLRDDLTDTSWAN